MKAELQIVAVCSAYLLCEQKSCSAFKLDPDYHRCTHLDTSNNRCNASSVAHWAMKHKIVERKEK